MFSPRHVLESEGKWTARPPKDPRVASDSADREAFAGEMKPRDSAEDRAEYRATACSGPATRIYEEALETSLGVPFTRGNRVRVLRNGIEIFLPMLDAIRNARESICFLTFIYWKGDIAWQFSDALGAAVMPRALLRRRTMGRRCPRSE